MNHHDGVVEVQCHDLELDAPIVFADPDQPRVAVAVAGTWSGTTESITNFAWALPMRWRLAERYHRRVRSTL